MDAGELGLAIQKRGSNDRGSASQDGVELGGGGGMNCAMSASPNLCSIVPLYFTASS
jgi:hypothetical protein